MLSRSVSPRVGHLSVFAIFLAFALAACETTPPPPSQSKGAYKVGTPYRVSGTWYYPREQPDYDETGFASWYGSDFHGKQTANGEIYNQNSMSAAHTTLPMPVKVRVTNLKNGRQVVLRVNDRGPFVKGRIIDVSSHAADLLGFKQAGTAMVRVEYLGRADPESFVSAKPVTEAAARTVSASAPISGVEAGDLAPPPGATVATADETTKPNPVMQSVSNEPEVQIVRVPENPEIFIQAGAFQNRNNAVQVKQQLVSLGMGTLAHITTARVRGNEFFRVRIGPMASVEAADKILNKVLDTGHKGARIVVD